MSRQRPKHIPHISTSTSSLLRNFMVNTARNYLGVVADTLVPELEAAQSLADLRHHFFDWREALRQSHDAKRRLAEYEWRLSALLS